MLPTMPVWHVTRRPLPLLTRISNDVHEPYGPSTKIEIQREPANCKRWPSYFKRCVLMKGSIRCDVMCLVS